MSRSAPGSAASERPAACLARQATDEIYRSVDHRLELFINDRVFSPALSDDGRLAYSKLAYTEPRLDGANFRAS